MSEKARKKGKRKKMATQIVAEIHDFTNCAVCREPLCTCFIRPCPRCLSDHCVTCHVRLKCNAVQRATWAIAK